MTMFVAFILLANVIVFSSFLFQCASSKRPTPQRKSQRSSKSRKSSRSSRSKSRRSSRSSRSSKSGKSKRSRRSSKRSSKSSRKSRKNKKVIAAIMADKKAAEDAVRSNAVAVPGLKVVDNSPAMTKVSYANIRVIPHELSFPPIGGLKHVRVKNSTGKRTAFMVKCSDNMLFSINPVFGIIEPDRDAQINILRESREQKHDKLVIITATHPDNRRSAEETFADIYNTNSHNYNISVVPLLAHQ